MDEVIIVISVSVILPIAVVFIIFFYSNKTAASKMKLLEKAIESGVDIDPAALMESLETKKKRSRTIKDRLIGKLVWGTMLLVFGVAAFLCFLFGLLNGRWCIYAGIVGISVGTALIVAYSVGRKMLEKEAVTETGRKLTGKAENILE